jgi:hypothetical protein
MAYDYDKRVLVPRRLTAGSTQTYEESLNKLQLEFVGAVGEGVYDYVTTLHKRIGRRSPWSEISGFTSWDYGTPRGGKSGLIEIRVFQKSISAYPNDIDPVIDITIEFSVGVGVVADTRGNRILVKRFDRKISPSQVGLQIGAGWEKLLTGSVDYGD